MKNICVLSYYNHLFSVFVISQGRVSGEGARGRGAWPAVGERARSDTRDIRV